MESVWPLDAVLNRSMGYRVRPRDGQLGGFEGIFDLPGSVMVDNGNVKVVITNMETATMTDGERAKIAKATKMLAETMSQQFGDTNMGALFHCPSPS